MEQSRTVMGMEKLTIVSHIIKQGNSYGMRIPKEYIDAKLLDTDKKMKYLVTLIPIKND